MKLPKYTYNNAKKLIQNNIGKDINFIYKESRGKMTRKKGKIDKVYTNIFTIKAIGAKQDETYTFSYCDIINYSLILDINNINLR